MIPFFIVVIAVSVALPPAVTSLYEQGWLLQRPTFLYETTWLVAFATSVIFVYLYRWGKAGYFVQLYLLSMALKLIACLAYCIFMILEDRQGAVPNVLYFMAIYFVLTALEIGFLYRKISDSPRP